jgi:hypothetical protein
MKRNLITLCACLCLGSSLFAQNFNRPVPAALFPYEFASNGFAGSDYFLFTNVMVGVQPSNPAYSTPYPSIVDSEGYLSWYWKPGISGCADFKYHPTDDLYTLNIGVNGAISFLVFDAQLNLIDTLEALNVEGDIHDLQRADNGNWLLVTAPVDTVDLSAYTFNGQQGGVATPILGFGIQEFDPTGALIFEWNSNDHISPTEGYTFYGYNPNLFDYCHGNAIEEDEDGHFLLSFRHLNAVYKIHRTSGDVLWKLGGQSSDFTFTNDAGFSGQHDVRRLPNGNYSVFDNSNMGSIPKKSRGVEYQLDTVNWTATKVNEDLHPTASYHMAMGSYRQFADGSALLGWGFSYRPKPSATFLDASDNILAEFFFRDSVMTYRALYSALPTFNRPEINCSNAGGQIVLTAPAASAYEWSTGETTQSITVLQTGVYQVWIPQGVGYAGSYPFEVNNLLNPCALALDELEAGANRSYELFDLLGRKVEHAVSGNVYLKLYEDGRVEHVLWTDF